MQKHSEVQLGAAIGRISLMVLIGAGQMQGAAAQSAPPTPASLESIIVSGTRAGSLLNETGSTVSVITAAELEERQIRFVSDALRQVPGMAVSRQGPAGTLTQVRIRGAEANHTVVVVDGVKINDPFTSEVDFAHLLSAQIDRIEILRGPQSVLYGSEAIGGVISIFTKRGDPGVQFEASAEAGSFSTYDGTAAVRGAGAAWNYALSASGFSTDGTNVSRFGSEDDGSRNRIFYARAGWAPSPGASVEGSVRYRNNRSMSDPQDFGFPPTPTFGLVVDGDQRIEGDQFDAIVRGRLTTGPIDHQLAFTRTKTEENTFVDGVFAGGFAGSRNRVDYQGTWRLGGASLPQSVTIAAEYERQQFES
ncbi:MAG: TonB-dependent receptor plug domain-containing protein, partial [Burkholderiaceae bacterium]|nr:TonB-dependent receptor plug domain-containing protein [Burkholderiaceae bacterium]